MFTLDQIREAHARVKSGADFPHYIQDLIILGVQKYDIIVHDGHGEYAGTDDYNLVSPPKYDTLTVADTSDTEGFTERLRAHQQGQTDYQTFCTDAADAGVEKWTVDTEAMTCTYYDTAGNVMLEEEIKKIGMKISEIYIKNFRSIREERIMFNSFNVLVGKNNHGKTNFFDAINWFDSAKKTEDSDKFDSSINIEVEIIYTGAQQGLREMQNEKNRESIRKLIGSADIVKIKKTSSDNKRCFIIDGSPTPSPAGFDSALNDFLPKIEFVPATARLNDVNQYKSTTPMGQMLGGVLTAIIESEPKYKLFQDTFYELFEGHDSTARQQLNLMGENVESFLEKQFPDGTKVKFSIESPIIEDLLKNFETEVDDGVNTSASRKGDGMQRALMLAIIQAYAKFRREKGIGKCFTFLLDEAELHLHPSAQRSLKNALNEIVKDGDQVFVSTHSSVLIAEDFESQSIYKVEKENKITRINKVTNIEKPYIIFELLGGSPSDLLLPRNFLIVEGHSECQFLQNIIKKFYPQFANIHIIAAEGNEGQQERTMNGINKVFCPLTTGENPIYKSKTVILCDKAHEIGDFEEFKKGYKLSENEDIFVLSEKSLEEYYPTPWKQAPEEVKKLQDEGKKVAYAKHVSEEITKEIFERDMPIIFSALEKANSRSFNPL